MSNVVDGNSFAEMFRRATEVDPFPYQARLATGDLPSILEIPTGLGKTAAAVLAWLFRRRFAGAEQRARTPRRLVYCLPMRVLVEQTRDAAVLWLHRLGVLAGSAEIDHHDRVVRYEPAWDDPTRIAVSVLMGGEEDGGWDLYPERDAVLIGTQDMLLSRALNRGYGMSRYRWPMHFGLLNSDCLWVADEVQLMGTGLSTTAQLQAFRRLLGVPAGLTTRTIWMSATLDPGWIGTVDVDQSLDVPGRLVLADSDRSVADVACRLAAPKALQRAAASIGDLKQLAGQIYGAHRSGTRTLSIVNTVKRAVALHAELEKITRKSASAPKLVLVHSRFRPRDRQSVVASLLEEPGPAGTIAVSTQVVEAGVDVSAATLFTEIAPWASLVQRFGRCNRRGEDPDARVFWVDLPSDEKQHEKLSPPYETGALIEARHRLEGLQDAGPNSLPRVALPFEHRHVIRRKDVLELFDTTPDLAGQDVDVSRFIRETTDLDLQVFWRDLPDSGPASDEPIAARDELCPVSLADARDLTKKGKLAAWKWDPLEETWERIGASTPLYPGLILLLPASSGRYTPKLGWDRDSSGGRVPVVSIPRGPGDHGYARECLCERSWMLLSEHTDRVLKEAERISNALGLADPLRADLLEAARWHDAGKAHPVFQRSLRGGSTDAPGGTLAKSARRNIRHERPGFRHELASGVLALMHGKGDLVAYLAASHHGKVRLSLRSLPCERRPAEPDRRFARGIFDGERIPGVDLGGGVALPETVIDLGYMELGGGSHGASWLERTIALRDSPALGPFCLAWLEAILKAADERASGAGT